MTALATAQPAASWEPPLQLDKDAAVDRTVRLVTGLTLWLGLLLLTYWWVANGGVVDLAHWESGLASVGRITGLWSADLLLVQVVLMSRLPPLEHAFGRDRLARIHRVVGFLSFSLLIAHIATLLWLLLVLAGIPITWPKLVGAAGSALLLVAAISWLDWRRRPTARTHLGGFFQRVLDGDAFNIIIRKAVAAAGSMLSPLGMGSVFVGVIVWILLFRRLLPALRTAFTTLHTVAVAALGVAILGTALNDGGITIWYTLTLAFTLTVSALWVDRTSHLNMIHRDAWHGGSADRLSVS